jgi:DNA-binding NarL/FixJ family response regulator
MIRLAIVEDHAVVAQGIQALLQDEPDIEHVGTAQDVASARDLLAREQPDVVLCDVVLGEGGDGLRLLAAGARGRGPAFIMFSAYQRPDYHAKALELGASGYLPKLASIEELTRAIRAVAAGGKAFPPSVLKSARSALTRPSDRQRQVIALVAGGHRNDEIARRLSIEVKTVEGQLRRLFDKYGVTNRIGLVRLAEREGWIDFPGENSHPE